MQSFSTVSAVPGPTASYHKNYNRCLLNVRSAPYATFAEPVNSGDSTPGAASANGLQFHPFSDLQGIIGLNPKVANGAFQFGMSEQ